MKSVIRKLYFMVLITNKTFIIIMHSSWTYHGLPFCTIYLCSPGHLPSNRKVPGWMLSWGFLLLLFPWARNFTPIASAIQLLNRKHIALCNQGTAEKEPSIADIVIPVRKKKMKCRKIARDGFHQIVRNFHSGYFDLFKKLLICIAA